MLVIFEGNEGCGKSELAEKFAKEYGTAVMKMHSHKNWRPESSIYPYPWHMNKAANWTWRFFMEMIRPTIMQANQLHVTDRSFITQAVYHPVFSDEPDWFNKSAYDSMPKHLATMPHIVFHIVRPGVYRENDEMIIEYGGDIDSLKQIDTEYDKYYIKHSKYINKIEIVNQNKTLEQLHGEICRHYELAKLKPFIID